MNAIIGIGCILLLVVPPTLVVMKGHGDTVGHAQSLPPRSQPAVQAVSRAAQQPVVVGRSTDGIGPSAEETAGAEMPRPALAANQVSASSTTLPQATNSSVTANQTAVSAPTNAAPVAGPPAATQPAAVVSAPQQASLDLAISEQVKKAVSQRTFQESDVIGGAFANTPFEDLSEDGILIGFRIGMRKFFAEDTIAYFQPIFLTPSGRVFGKVHGSKSKTLRTLDAVAPDGYAVGAMEPRGGGGLAALTLTYMRINGTRLDPTDLMVTPRIGGLGGGPAVLNGNGTPIIGVCGRMDDKEDWPGIGLIYLKATPVIKRH